MKKFFLLLILALPFVFTSCDKDDDIENTLNGTVWESYEKDEYHETTYILYFYEDTYKEVYKVKYLDEEDLDTDIQEDEGRYTYEYPIVKLKMFAREFKGTIIDKKTMLVDDMEDETLIFKKK